MRSSQVSGTISEESPAVGAKKFLVWITVGWVSGAGTVFLVLLVLTLGAAQESDDLAGAGSVIAAAAMTAIFLQFMWPFLLVLFPVTAALWPVIARVVPVVEGTLAGVLLGGVVISLLIVSGIYGLFWGINAELNAYVVMIWVYSSLMIPRLTIPSLRPGVFCRKRPRVTPSP